MINIEHIVVASPEQMQFIIEGMRNPMNSWAKSDSLYYPEYEDDYGNIKHSDFFLGEQDHRLMTKLAKAGTDHRKYLRMIPVYVRITAPLYWWKEFDTYKVGTVSNSCSTMHKIAEKEFTLDDFSTEHLFYADVPNDSVYAYPLRDKQYALSSMELLQTTIEMLNIYRNALCLNYFKDISKKEIWWQMIQLLPSSYNQTRNVMMNYEVLANIYKSRKDHKLDEWQEFCKFIEAVPYSDLIIGA